MSDAWAGGSTRAWRAARRRALKRDDHTCQQCGADAEQVDHIRPRSQGGTDDLANLRSLCRRCHLAKTRGESAAGRRRQAAQGYHPAERHPGLR